MPCQSSRLVGTIVQRACWCSSTFSPLRETWKLVRPSATFSSLRVERSNRYSVCCGGPGCVFLYVGRFTAVKRLPLLIAAHARATERLGSSAPLVLVGGHPGEWEGEHPLTTARRIGNRQVFLAGWR